MNLLETYDSLLQDWRKVFSLYHARCHQPPRWKAHLAKSHFRNAPAGSRSVAGLSASASDFQGYLRHRPSVLSIGAPITVSALAVPGIRINCSIRSLTGYPRCWLRSRPP